MTVRSFRPHSTLPGAPLTGALVGLFVLLSACSPPSPPQVGADASGRPSPDTVGQTPATRVQPEAQPPAAQAPATTGPRAKAQTAAAGPARLQPLVDYQFERVFEQPVQGLALGNAPRLALLADDPWFFDQTGWRKIPRAAQTRPGRGQEEHVEIFFGRDNQPRLVGYRREAATGGERLSPVYLRHKRTGWAPEPAELGQLARAKGPLYGILGEADPEVVCAAGQLCLIKRVSGWNTAPAQNEPALVVLSAGEVFQATASGVDQLSEDRWHKVANHPPGGAPLGLWGDASGLRYAVAAGSLYQLTPHGWQVVPLPALGLCGIVGLAPDNLWAYGEKGLLHFDGQTWRQAEAALGQVLHAQLRDRSAIYLATSTGLWVGGPKLAPDGLALPAGHRVVAAGRFPLAQTEERPSVTDAAFTARMTRLADAIKRGDGAIPPGVFFPVEGYAQVKDIPEPEKDFEHRLLRNFARDLKEYHRQLGPDAAQTEFLGVDVSEEKVAWMKPGSEGNRVGYYRVLRAALRFRLTSGAERTLELTSMISWRGEWYVVHLHGFQ